MDLESDDDDEEEKEEEKEDDGREMKRTFVAVCFEMEKERDDDDGKGTPMPTTREKRCNTFENDDDDDDDDDVVVAWERRRLRVHDWRTVEDADGARRREDDDHEEERKEISKEPEVYFDVLVSFLAASGDESVLLRKMWKRVAREEKKPFFGGGKMKVKDADVLMSAPCRFPFLKRRDDENTYSFDGGKSKEDVKENFLKNGYLSATEDRNRVSRTLVDAFRTKTNERIEEILNAMNENHSYVSVGTDVFAYKEIGSRGKYRFDALFDKEKEEEDELFIFAKSQAPWVELVNEILRNDNVEYNDIDINISIIWTEPGCLDQEWHCDGAHRGDQETYDEQTGTLLKTHASPYAVCVFMTLLDLDEKVGYTEFWPTSHKNAGLIGFGPAAHVLGGVQSSKTAKSGGWVMYDYRLMHRGIGNKSKYTRRPILQFLYAVDGYKERKNYGTESVFCPNRK